MASARCSPIQLLYCSINVANHLLAAVKSTRIYYSDWLIYVTIKFLKLLDNYSLEDRLSNENQLLSWVYCVST